MEKINESEFINQILFHQNTNINQYFFSDVHHLLGGTLNQLVPLLTKRYFKALNLLSDHLSTSCVRSAWEWPDHLPTNRHCTDIMAAENVIFLTICN